MGGSENLPGIRGIKRQIPHRIMGTKWVYFKEDHITITKKGNARQLQSVLPTSPVKCTGAIQELNRT